MNTTVPTEQHKAVLPTSPWAMIEGDLKAIAEHESPSSHELPFLTALGFIGGEDGALLSSEGNEYYRHRYLRNEKEEALGVLRAAALKHEAVLVTIQLLYGVKDASRENVLSILKSHGMWSYQDERPLTNFLEFLNICGLATYSRKHGSIKVIADPFEHDELPQVMFVEPDRPYSNRMWLKKVIGKSEGHLRWFDKHFTSSGLECLSEALDANIVSRVSILSLDLPDLHGPNVRRDYRDLKTELAGKGIELHWYVVDSKNVRDIHDRWILAENGAWNLPDVNTIISGKRSEISASPYGETMQRAFDEYVLAAKEIS